jgi:hypothetical protein
MTQEQQALLAIEEILARLIRIETRVCKLMAALAVEPSNKDGYGAKP